MKIEQNMKITFTAEALKKPEGMNLKAELAWNYFQFNSGCWQAAECGDGTILITDESGDLCTGMMFFDLSTFVEWLTDAAEEHLEDGPDDFLTFSGAIHPELLQFCDVRTAIFRRLNVKTDMNVSGGENA